MKTAAIAILSFMILPLTMSATPDQLLVHVNGQETPTAIEITDQTKISFGNTTLDIKQPSGNLSIEIADIDRLTFDLETSSEDEIDMPLTDDVTFSVTGRHVTITSSSGTPLTLTVYDATGHCIESVSGTGCVETDFSDRRPGVYILVCGNKTIKYLNR